jgi:tryptophan halogenase
MIGQRIMPESYHPAVDLIADKELDELVGGVRRVIATCVDAMPRHEQFIARYCAADKM